jgi:hypothetical protein
VAAAKFFQNAPGERIRDASGQERGWISRPTDHSGGLRCGRMSRADTTPAATSSPMNVRKKMKAAMAESLRLSRSGRDRLFVDVH